MRQIKIST